MFYIKNVNYKNVLKVTELKIKEHEITCIVGESGGGKTTLLRLLSKLDSPSEGEITFKGEPLDELDSVSYRKKVVLLPQKPFIFPKTIYDNLVKGLTFHNKKIDEAHLMDALDFVDLHKPLTFDASNLSGGEAQRLAIARIVVLDPEVILLDEPSSALDDETEAFVIKAMVDYVQREGKTLIMVTHSKAVAQRYGDSVVTIEKGQLKGRVDNAK